MKTWFQLGREQELCRCEAMAIAKRLGFGGEFTPFNRAGLCAAELALYEAHQVAREAGGIVRVIEELGVLERPDTRIIIERLKTAGVLDAWAGLGKKVEFGVSRLPAQSPTPKLYDWQQRLGSELKDELKRRQARCRYIPWPKEQLSQLSTVQVSENGLLESPPGREVVVWEDHDRLSSPFAPPRSVEKENLSPLSLFHEKGDGGWGSRWKSNFRLGLTTWVQPYEAFAHRDMDRPQRMQRRGMLPPKLARMLINLGRTAQTKILLDPFCGGGGLLAEGLALGLEAWGCDWDERAVAATRENLTWLQETHPNLPPWRVWCGDARKLIGQLQPLTVDLVATEVDLGPPLRREAEPAKVQEYIRKLKPTYLKALGQVRALLRPGGRAVVALPCWPTGSGLMHVPVKSELAMMGYSEVSFDFSLERASAGEPIVYLRPGQFVGRAIYVLE